MRTVHVVSWVYWNGDEQGGGGFNWFWPQFEDAALKAFDKEVAAWQGAVARVRLVDVEVPDDMSAEQITEYIDNDIDLIELSPSRGGLPARKVALVGQS